MEKILPERQLMPEGQCLPIHSYASKDDVANVSAMASCAKEVADTANERIDNLQTDLATCIDTGNVEANNIESDTATIQTGNIGSLTSNSIEVDTITANEVCADILGGQCGSINNLNANNITANCIEVQDICINNDICVNNICGTLCGNVCGTDACFSHNINVCSCVNAKYINSTKAYATCVCGSCCVQGYNVQATCCLCGKEACISCKLSAPKIDNVNLISHNKNNTVSNGKYIFVTLCQGHAYFGNETLLPSTNWAVSINAAHEAAEIITDNSNCIEAVYSNDRGCFYIEMKCPYSGGFQYEISDTNAVAPVWKASSFVVPEEYTKRNIIEDKQFTFTGSLYFDKAAYENMSVEKLEINEITAKDNNEVVFTSPINACCGICGDFENAECLGGCTLNEVLYDAREPICELIPPQATCSNQLADKCFVNSSISTNTANFVGTYDDVACLPTVGVTNNDYAFITSCDSCTGTITYSRYKYVASTATWLCEYSLNTSGFTSDQLEAINSGITCTLVGKITDVHNCTIQINQNGNCVGSFTLNQNTNKCIDINGGGIAVCQGNYTNCFNVLGSSCGTNKECVFSNTSIKMQPSTGTLFASCFCGTATNAICFNGCTYECTCADILSNTYKKCTTLPTCATVPIPLISDYCVMLPSTSDTWSTTYYYCKGNRCCDKLTVANICANVIDVGTINAITFCGNATSASLVCMRSCNQNVNYPIAIWGGSTANCVCALAKSGNTVAPFTWNPTCRHFCLGNTTTGVGEIHCATLCGTASRSIQIKRNASTVNQDLHLAMLSGCDTNSCSDVYVSNCCPLTYNPSTGLLCATCIQGCFIGSITCAECAKCATCVCISSISTNTDIPLVGATNGYQTLCTSSCMPTVNACTGAITLYPSKCVTCGDVTARRYVINNLCYIEVKWGSAIECDLQKALKCTLPGTWWCNNKCYAPVQGWIRASGGDVCVYHVLHVDCDTKYSLQDYQGCWIQMCGTKTVCWNDPGAIVLGPIWW